MGVLALLYTLQVRRLLSVSDTFIIDNEQEDDGKSEFSNSVSCRVYKVPLRDVVDFYYPAGVASVPVSYTRFPRYILQV